MNAVKKSDDIVKGVTKDLIKWVIIATITALFSTVLISRDLKDRVGKLEQQRNVEAKLLCKVATAVNALKKGDALDEACAELIGL